jgi:integrase
MSEEANLKQPVIDEFNRVRDECEKLPLARPEPRAAKNARPVRDSKSTRGVFEKVPGSGVFWIRFVDSEGKYRREKIGSKSAAIKLYRRRKADADEGVKLPQKLRRRIIPFAEVADDAVVYVKAKYARPADDVARLEVIKGWFAGKSTESLTLDEIESRLEDAKAVNKWAASTRNHFHNLLSLTFRLAIRKRKVKESPMLGLEKLSEKNEIVRWLTADEENALRAAIRSNPVWAAHEPELDLALNTGLRRGSMYRDLVWENVDLEARTLTIPRTKNGDSIVLPINTQAMRALLIFRSRGDGRGRVVRNAAGRTLTYNADWFRPAVRASGIARFRWHDCRHTFASRLRQAGVPLGNIAELLGHKTLAMTRRYSHLAISNLHQAVSLIGKTDTTVAPAPIAEVRPDAYVQ